MGDRPVAHFHAEGVSRIINKPEIVPARDVGQLVQLAGMAVDMDRQDRGRPGRDGGLDLVGIERIVFRLNIDKHRPDLVPEQGMGRRHERDTGS